MQFLFVMDPPERVIVGHDTTFAVMQALTARGHELWFCEPKHLAIDTSSRDAATRHAEPVALACRTAVVAKQGEHMPVLERTRVSLNSFAAVLMRKDPPFDMDYVFATYLLDAVGPQTRVVNRPEGLRAANEKMFIHRVPQLMPPTLVSADAQQIAEFCREQRGACILKPLDLMGGRGIFLLRSDDPNFNAILETSTARGTRWQMVQRLLDISTGDKRIMVLDGEPLGAIVRYPAKGEHRANMAAGGTAEYAELTARDREICATMAPLLREYGLYLTGLDVIDGHLTEVNVTSPTGICEIDKMGGLDTAGRIADWLVAGAA